jgi:hypothetical protein
MNFVKTRPLPVVSFPRMLAILTAIIFGACVASETVQEPQVEAGVELRAPAYPLVTIDPYTSAWSTSDNLFDTPVKHWTGRNHSLIGAIRVDEKTYRFLGKEEIPLKPILPDAKHKTWVAKYTNRKPAEGWQTLGFNDSSWQTGEAGFGTPNTFDTKTAWQSPEIWVRREFELPPINEDGELYLIYAHDDDFELYLNGTQIVNTGNRARGHVVEKLDRSLLNPRGKNIIAAHCLDRGGLAYVDFGIFSESDQKPIFAEAAIQNSVKITATQTKYNFTCGPVDLEIEFVPGKLHQLPDRVERWTEAQRRHLL